MSMNFQNLKGAIGKPVAIICQQNGINGEIRGILESVDDPESIKLMAPSPYLNIPINNGKNKVVKVYDKNRIVIFDGEAEA